MIIEEEVVSCVKYALPENERDGQLTGGTASIATGLSSLVRSASFIECMAEKHLNSGKISIGVYAFVSRSAIEEPGKLFTLFGPQAGSKSRYFATRGDENINIESNGVNNDGFDNKIDAENGAQTRNHGFEDHDVEMDASQQIAEDVMRGSEASLGSAPVHLNQLMVPKRDLVTNEPATSSSFSIPEEVLARCMSFCLDISGSTSHPSNYVGKDLESVNAKKLSKVVKVIFKKYKSNLSERGLKTHGLQYLSLLPTELRGKEITLPLLRLCRSSTSGAPYTKMGSLKVKLNVSKADSNAKDQNIALLAALMYHRKHGMDIEGMLSQDAGKGLGPEGCKKNSLCRGERLKSRCIDEARDVCQFFASVSGKQKLVARGVVDPYTTFLFGTEVSASCMVIRISSVLCDSGFEGRTIRDRCNSIGSAYIWPKNDISRVQLLGDLGDVIGTGILVQGKLITIKRIPRNSLDVSNAVLVCDVEVAEGMEEENYPFSEWYKSSSMQKLELPFVRDCFANQQDSNSASDGKAVPMKVGEVSQNWRKAMLWHKDFMKSDYKTS